MKETEHSRDVTPVEGVDPTSSSSVEEERVSIESQLVQAESCKNRGNVEFQKGKTLAKHTAGKNLITDACLQYVEGINVLKNLDASISCLQKKNEVSTAVSAVQSRDIIATTRLLSRANTVRSALFLNLAACNLLLDEWNAAMACCDEVIDRCRDVVAMVSPSVDDTDTKVVPRNQQAELATIAEGDGDEERHRNVNMAAKALYRRSTARVGIRDLSGAHDDLILAQRLRPGDVPIRRELKRVGKMLADEEARAKLRKETEEGRRRIERNKRRPTTDTPALFTDGDGGADSVINRSHSESLNPVRVDEVSNRGNHSEGVPQDIRSQRRSICGEAAERRMLREQEDIEDRATMEDDKDEETFSTLNGGHGRDDIYAWNQSIREVHVCVLIPKWAQAKDVRVEFRRMHLIVKVASMMDRAKHVNQETPDSDVNTPVPEAEIILNGKLSRPIEVGESLWTLERPGQVYLYLQKELLVDGAPGSEWWATVMEGDPEIDISTCDAGSKISEYPENARMRGAKAFWEHQQKTPEQRQEEDENKERLRDARRQMEEEVEQRQRDLDKALKDPAKAELYRKLTEVMPNVPITLK